jgi:hypothetical protein
LGEGIQVCSSKGPGPLQIGDNQKNVKIGWGHLEILRNMKPEKLNFTSSTKASWLKS